MMVRPHPRSRRILPLMLAICLSMPMLTRSGPVAAQDAADSQVRATTPRPAHIHSGTCDELGIVVFSLADVQSYAFDPNQSGREVEVIVGRADAELTDLFEEPFALHIHESEQNKQNYIACGAIGERPPPPWQPSDGLSIELQPQADSGFSGFVSLRPESGGGTTVTFVLVPPAPPDSGGDEAASTAEAGATSNYTSPSYGYSLDYDDSWTVEDETSDGETDRFVLSNGTSFVSFVGTRGFDGDPAACVSDFAQQALLDPAVGAVTPATDAAGNPLEGSDPQGGAFAVFDHDYTFSDGTTIAYSLFVGCATIEPGTSVLAILQNVPRAAYNEQIPVRDALLAGLHPAEGSGAGTTEVATGPEVTPETEVASGGESGSEALAVGIEDFDFAPPTVEVAAGSSVTWTNQGQAPHTATADDGSFDTGQLDPGQSATVTFDTPGTFAYHCAIHPNMQGTVVVT